MLTSPPRVWAHVAGSFVLHPPNVLFAEMTQVCPETEETRTVAVWGGVPTWILKVAQGPSLPSLLEIGQCLTQYLILVGVAMLERRAF